MRTIEELRASMRRTFVQITIEELTSLIDAAEPYKAERAHLIISAENNDTLKELDIDDVVAELVRRGPEAVAYAMAGLQRAGAA